MFQKLKHSQLLTSCLESSSLLPSCPFSLVQANSRDLSSLSTLCRALLGSVNDTKMDIQYPSFFVIYLLKHPQPYVHYPLNTHPVSGAGIRTGFRVVNRTKMAPWYQDVLFWLDNFYDSPFYMLGHFPDSFHPSPLGWFIFLKGSGPHGVPYPLRVRVSPWAW